MKNGGNICIELYNENIRVKSCIKYEKYDVNEIDKNRIICQIQKTGNTFFYIKNIDIEVENLKLPISQLNQLRRQAIEALEKALENSITRDYKGEINPILKLDKPQICERPKINLYLQKWDENIDYSKFDYHEIYVPFKDCIQNTKIRDCIVVLPTIVDKIYEKLIFANKQVFDQVKAVAITHSSQVELLQRLGIHKKIVADYTLNITNSLSQKAIKDMEIKRFTISTELDKNTINQFPEDLEKELVVYGRTCLMTSKYCPVGKNENCNLACQKGNYELKDRKDFVFPVVCDKINCHSKIYNSKILSTDYKSLAVDFVRIDLLNEKEDQIEKIISIVKSARKFSGTNYTNGNL